MEKKIKEKVKILLVDDLKDNLLALEGLLRRDDLEIFQVTSGTLALELMMIQDFALALIDVQMPILNGFELAELMRGASKTKHVPIIFVTATAKEQGFLFKGYESGAVDFLHKPLDTHAVKSKVNIFIELYRQKKELKELLARLNETQAELEHSVQMREEFMSIASHELKTPLTSLVLQSQLRMRNLKRGDFSSFTPERLVKMVEGDERQLMRINHLIDDMLDVSRITSGKLSMTFEHFDLCEVVREIIERNSELFLAAGCRVESIFCKTALGNWDRFRIEQVVTNLLTNAMRYGGGKPISIEVRCSNDQVELIVRDQGRGVAAENHARIFQRFERAVPGSEISGLGLGLYIVSQILEAHQGSIHIESAVGQGAAFTVRLPLLVEEEV